MVESYDIFIPVYDSIRPIVESGLETELIIGIFIEDILKEAKRLDIKIDDKKLFLNGLEKYFIGFGITTNEHETKLGERIIIFKKGKKEEETLEFYSGKFKCRIYKLLKKKAIYHAIMECQSEELNIKYSFEANFAKYFPEFDMNYSSSTKTIKMKIHHSVIALMFKQFLDSLKYLRHFEVAYKGFPGGEDIPGSEELYKEYYAVITFDLLDNGDVRIEKLEDATYKIPPKPIPIIGLEKLPSVSPGFKYHEKIDIHKDIIDNLRTFLDILK